MESEGSLRAIKKGFRAGDKAIRNGLTEGTRVKHEKWLNELATCRTWTDAVHVVENRRQKKKWRYSTTRTVLGTIMGAVPRASYYHIPCRLKDPKSAEWKDYVRSIENGVMAEIDSISQAKPATSEVIDAMIKLCYQRRQKELAAYIILMWACAARPECTGKVRSANVSMSQGGSLKVRFVEGKGVTMRRRPYTVLTDAHGWETQLGDFLRSRKNATFLFLNVKSLKKQLSAALREQDVEMSTYSVRRGAAL